MEVRYGTIAIFADIVFHNGIISTASEAIARRKGSVSITHDPDNSTFFNLAELKAINYQIMNKFNYWRVMHTRLTSEVEARRKRTPHRTPVSNAPFGLIMR
jgi:hypothetical protein